jgi:hypothetical protein
VRSLESGELPARLKDPGMSDNIWGLIKRCWAQIPSERPTMQEIMEAFPPLTAQQQKEEERKTIPAGAPEAYTKFWNMQIP